jgi:hypothetical protein
LDTLGAGLRLDAGGACSESVGRRLDGGACSESVGRRLDAGAGGSGRGGGGLAFVGGGGLELVGALPAISRIEGGRAEYAPALATGLLTPEAI